MTEAPQRPPRRDFLGSAVWRELTLYGKFEQVVALVLAGLISLVILATMFDLLREIVGSLWAESYGGGAEPFHVFFGKIMTVLIAMELNHTIIDVAQRKSHVVQVRTVLLVALLALSRKFIILDLKSVSPLGVFALGFSVVALAGANWILERAAVQEAQELSDHEPGPVEYHG